MNGTEERDISLVNGPGGRVWPDMFKGQCVNYNIVIKNTDSGA